MRNINDPIQVHQMPYFVDVMEVVVVTFIERNIL
jgi:hypothetical protein